MENLGENMAEENRVLCIMKGIAIAIGLSLVLILVLSILLSISNIKENIIIPTVIFITSFSILVGSFLVAKRIKQRGIAYGSIVGLVYMVVLYMISSILNGDFSLNVTAVVMILFGIIGGAIGGILGVNLK